MSGEVYFSSGDLLEYVRPVSLEGEQKEKKLTLRGIVRGFEVRDDGQVSVWLEEGSMGDEPRPVQLELDQAGEPVANSRRYDERMEPEFVALSLDYLLSLEPEVVRRGNNPWEMSMFVPGGEPYGD